MLGKKLSWGFTLPEMIVVVAIVGVFSAIAAPNLMRLNTKSTGVECVYRRRAVEGAKASYVADRGGATMELTSAGDQAALEGYMPGPAANFTICPKGGPETAAQDGYANVYSLYTEVSCPNHGTSKEGWKQ